ncbi:MAG: UbiA family prenyltransferase [Tepidisphaerales bacterium]
MSLAQHVLTLLQFTRAALVFTAWSNFLAAALLSRATGGAAVAGWGTLVLGLVCSASLYAFGMALNDLVDRRRDALLAATRPLPSGRLALSSAHLVVAALGTTGLTCGLLFAWRVGDVGSAAFVLMTLALINLYNFVGKYLVSAGLITLGLVRLAHAAIASPDLPVVWHPLWLFTHIAVVASVAYVWEEKRPRMTPLHSAVVAGSVAAVNVGVVTAVLARKLPRVTDGTDPATAVLSVLAFFPRADAVASGATGGLLGPVIASFLFAAVAWRIGRQIGDARARSADDTSLSPPLRERRRAAGRQLMLAGLLWLIVYDAAFVLGYVGWREALLVLMLLPLAYGAVRLMRAASGLSQLRKPLEFRLPSAPSHPENP